MAVIKKTSFEISGGVNVDGSPRPVSYPVEHHDCSGIPENNAIFTGVVSNVDAGNPPHSTPSSPEDFVNYAQANFKPQNTPSNAPHPTAQGSPTYADPFGHDGSDTSDSE